MLSHYKATRIYLFCLVIHDYGKQFLPKLPEPGREKFYVTFSSGDLFPCHLCCSHRAPAEAALLPEIPPQLQLYLCLATSCSNISSCLRHHVFVIDGLWCLEYKGVGGYLMEPPLIASISSQFHVQCHNADSLELALMGVLIPQKPANAQSQDHSIQKAHW